MPRGGKRKGAGAPKGNMNAVKHGGYSQRIKKSAALFILLPEAREFMAAILRGERHERDRLFLDIIRMANRLVRDNPGIEQTIRKMLAKRLEDADPRIWQLLESYADREKTIIQSNESLMQTLAGSLFTRPVALEPDLARSLETYTDDHCPFIACCLVGGYPCQFDRPWLDPHPFWTAAPDKPED